MYSLLYYHPSFDIPTIHLSIKELALPLFQIFLVRMNEGMEQDRSFPKNGLTELPLYKWIAYLFCSWAATLQVLMGAVPSHMGDMCMRRVRGGQSEEAGGGHKHRETIP